MNQLLNKKKIFFRGKTFKENTPSWNSYVDLPFTFIIVLTGTPRDHSQTDASTQNANIFDINIVAKTGMTVVARAGGTFIFAFESKIIVLLRERDPDRQQCTQTDRPGS